ncbi:MAG: hypothetical protein H7Y42_04115 [Chitinophagaceae bacterium]|nr:hypothetical protein [Chitinophagaceae bacterium]
MALEVRELIIRATVVQEGIGTGITNPSPGTNNDISNEEELITTCVEKILEILKSKDGR